MFLALKSSICIYSFMDLHRFPTAEERYPRAGKVIEHPYCGTENCCQQCEQLELFPVSIYTKDTKQNMASSALDDKNKSK